MGRLVYLVLAWWITFFALGPPALAAEIGTGKTYTTHPNGSTSRITTFCQDTGANGSCDSGTAAAPNGNWTQPVSCPGAKEMTVHLGQGAAVTGATLATVYGCRTGYTSSQSPAHASNVAYCSELTGVSATGGVACIVQDATTYGSIAGTDRCVILSQLSDTDNDTSGGPISFPDQRGCTDFVVSIEKAQTSCITPNDIKILEGNSGTAALPTVWTTITTLTGVIDPLIQGVNFGRTPRGAIMSTNTASADADCTDVHVTATLKCPFGPPDYLSDVAPDLSVPTHAAAQQIVALFSCSSSNCEAGYLEATCLN